VPLGIGCWWQTGMGGCKEGGTMSRAKEWGGESSGKLPDT